MAARYNFSAKRKRTRSLLLATILSIVTILSLFLSEVTKGAVPINASGLAQCFASNPEILLMGIGIALNSMRNELLKKRKSSWEKELLGGLICTYILITISLYVSIKTSTLVADKENIDTIANVIMHGYLSSIWVSIGCIAAGKS